MSRPSEVGGKTFPPTVGWKYICLTVGGMATFPLIPLLFWTAGVRAQGLALVIVRKTLAELNEQL